MSKTGQDKPRWTTGRPTVKPSVCAVPFVQMMRMHTNLSVIAMIKEAAP